MAEQATVWPDGVIDVIEGPWAGWRTWGELDAFESMVGPFYWRAGADGAIRCAFRAEPRHMNASGFMHGGCLMTFADYSAFAIGMSALSDDWSVTAAFNAEFVGAVSAGALVEAGGEVIRGGRSLVFIRGLVTADGDPALSFSVVAKKAARRS
ncbi:MAG: PaaI family thioesterase [Phenylobacterium sp.]|uniref:PaaI family thioesterase n=1 Tax=Phenylobacterium sp. TaxID=1871053 RepID=UPI0027336508|nr:PaaI family thioesterase [Phenylobacterium sp.]MDP3173374.1 PaaI family thioesterase [Phenylobacterium sp.]